MRARSIALGLLSLVCSCRNAATVSLPPQQQAQQPQQQLNVDPTALSTGAVTGPAAAPAPGVCMRPAASKWTSMSKGGPVFGDVADPIGVWVDDHTLFAWDAYRGIEEARFYDASCNQWYSTPLPASLPAKFTFDRRYGFGAFGDRLFVYGPTWDPPKGQDVPAGPFRVIVFDPKARTWTDASPPPALAGRNASPQVGDGKLVLLENGKACVLDILTGKWSAAAERMPIAGVEPGCTRVSSEAIDIWTDGAHQRLDFASLRWTKQALPSARFQHCKVLPLDGATDLVTLAVIVPPKVVAGMVVDRKAASHIEVSPTGRDGIWLQTAGNEIWAGDQEAGFYHYDRKNQQWSPVALPPSRLPGKSPISFRLETVGKSAVLRKIDPPPIGAPGQPAPKESKVEAWVYRNGAFGSPMDLGLHLEECEAIQEVTGKLCRFDGSKISLMDPETAKVELTLPSSPVTGYLRRPGKAFLVAWGVTETRAGNNCDNPFHPTVRQPNQPICTPSHGMTFTQAGEGGAVFRFGP